MNHPEPHLFEFLSRVEFKTCFAVAFVADAADYAGAYPLNDASFCTPGTPPGTSAESWEESFRRALRNLAFEHGYPFEAVRAEPDGRILAGSPICPENRLYVLMFADGGLPHVPDALNSAITDLATKCPSFDAGPLRAALADVEEAVAAVRIDPEGDVLRDRLRSAAFASLGLVRDPQALN